MARDVTPTNQTSHNFQFSSSKDLSKQKPPPHQTSATNTNTSDKGKGEGGRCDKKSTSESSKAGLQFAVGRIGRYLPSGRIRYATRYWRPSWNSSSAKILELAANGARDNKKTRIVPRHIILAIRHDEELNKLLLGGVMIASGGVLPNIPAVILPKKSESKETA
jgi:histone H2A